MSTWQPIDTAPKDGTCVLLWIPGLRECRHLGRFLVYETFTNGVSTYRSEKWEWGAMILGDEKRPEPSHWQELPGGPA